MTDPTTKQYRWESNRWGWYAYVRDSDGEIVGQVADDHGSYRAYVRGTSKNYITREAAQKRVESVINGN